MIVAGVVFGIFGSGKENCIFVVQKFFLAEIQPWSKFSNAGMFPPPKIQPIETNEPKKFEEKQDNNV